MRGVDERVPDSGRRRRSIVNERELLEAVRIECESMGASLRVLTLEEMPTSEQIRAFASASGIIGAHGAGFSNIVFPDAASCLVELPPYNPISSRMLAAPLGMQPPLNLYRQQFTMHDRDASIDLSAAVALLHTCLLRSTSGGGA